MTASEVSEQRGLCREYGSVGSRRRIQCEQGEKNGVSGNIVTVLVGFVVVSVMTTR